MRFLKKNLNIFSISISLYAYKEEKKKKLGREKKTLVATYGIYIYYYTLLTKRIIYTLPWSDLYRGITQEKTV